MLTQERFEEIVRIISRDGAATVQELAQQLETSESTVRRDLIQLDRLGKVRKVHGGATAAVQLEAVPERNMQEKYSRNIEAKRRIAAYAASLVTADDFVFLDAGSTTEQLAEFLTEYNATYMTNGITLAQKLAAKGFKTILVPGKVKATTDAVIGSAAVEFLRDYYFTKGFFGTNGITVEAGFTTPDNEEADNKRMAMKHCHKPYVLADNGKFGHLSKVSFGALKQAAIITTDGGKLSLKAYKQYTEVVEL